MKCKSPSKWMITRHKSRWFHRISMYAPLEAALPVLRTQLAESGIQLGQSNISGESFSGQQQAASQQQQSQRTVNHKPLAGERRRYASGSRLFTRARNRQQRR